MAPNKQEALLAQFRESAKHGRISSQTYEHLRNILFNPHTHSFDVTAELLVDELIKDTITIQEAYDILSSLDTDKLMTVQGKPASSADVDRYNRYVAYLKDQPNAYTHKKDFIFDVFGYAWSQLNA